MPARTVPEQAVPKRVSDAILRMVAPLHREYGYDFSYRVLVRGHTIAAADVDPRLARVGKTTYRTS